MTHTFHPTILREYDIRGIVGSTLSAHDAYALGRSFAALARSEDVSSIAVGRDGRTHSQEMQDALAAAAAVGDDNIMKKTSGRVFPEKFTHGTSAQRQRWFMTGHRAEDINACNTFDNQP